MLLIWGPDWCNIQDFLYWRLIGSAYCWMPKIALIFSLYGFCFCEKTKRRKTGFILYVPTMRSDIKSWIFAKLNYFIVRYNDTSKNVYPVFAGLKFYTFFDKYDLYPRHFNFFKLIRWNFLECSYLCPWLHFSLNDMAIYCFPLFFLCCLWAVTISERITHIIYTVKLFWILLHFFSHTHNYQNLRPVKTIHIYENANRLLTVWIIFYMLNLA